MKRRSFLKKGVSGLVGIGLPLGSRYQTQQNEPGPIDSGTIKEFVIAGHGDLEKVKDMIAEMPNLIYCRHDWGGGDFEEAIEGAGHLGNKEIATYLIDKGARVNLFVLTMLGKTNLVKPVLEAYPNLVSAKGPHGFSLLHHAKQGGEDAEELFEYLSEKGLEEMQFEMS
ncbi:MAG: hypothetical protein R3222_10735 [Balneolaceae bacterium]|nr:hypothetical protein [Balneolaceae bacterium]